VRWETPLVLVAVALVTLLAATALPTGLAAATALVAVAAAVLVTELAERRRLRRLTGQVGRWLADEDPTPLQVPVSSAWHDLAVAVSALGGAYRRQGTRLDLERPWRVELVDSLAQPALLFDAQARLRAANDPARELLHIPIDLAGATVLQTIGSPAIADAVRQTRRHGGPVGLDLEHNGLDLRVAVTLVGDETLVILTDRTRERRIEELRRNFVVNASHELKTPVTSIQTLAEALAVTVVDDPARTATLVGQLGLEAQRLARLLHDLLDLRRLEERGPLERVPVDLAERARLVLADQVPRAEEADVTLALEAPDHAMVAGVAGDLEVIVKNLVGNAIQYNRPGGSVTVTIEARDGQQVLTVTDTGIGIPRQDLQRVFERFYRVDAARSRETGGTGLGLSIVRHAVERHGGSIRVDSLLGEGTTFTVTLPIEPTR
jgi:two-component system, OmpR family, sensor histidine kinase SenX3